MYREWPLPHAEVRCAWAVRSDVSDEWTHPATEFWGLAFGTTADGVFAELMGPVAGPQYFDLRAGDHSWGVEFRAHVFLRGVAKESFGTVQRLPVNSGRFMLDGIPYEIPDEDHLGDVVSALIEGGALVAEPSVELALSGGSGTDGRTLRRQIRRVTALNRQQIAGVARAREAFRLLSDGVGIAEVVHRVGYSDQAHLTRSLRQLAGRTPRQILSGR